MRTIRTRTGIIIIVAFATVAFSVSFALSRLPRKSEWERFRVEYPERAIRANLRQVALAASVYLRSHRADEVTYADLLRDGRVIDRPIKPILGEDYHTIRLPRTASKVDVVTKDGQTITCEFGTLGIGSIGLSPVGLPPEDDFNIHRNTNRDHHDP
ncbi:hypothetical protein [Anaerobaca lacustris]|uniref:Uncharacterized protein n=1 Tax=Anaerobaca lacustris TaxID=3044600 RepID=A0AAW6U4P2_9BACT|nr:hypothetical protein [Sedimentisphaerales bacterium M17dextr]